MTRITEATGALLAALGVHAAAFALLSVLPPGVGGTAPDPLTIATPGAALTARLAAMDAAPDVAVPASAPAASMPPPDLPVPPAAALPSSSLAPPALPAVAAPDVPAAAPEAKAAPFRPKARPRTAAPAAPASSGAARSGAAASAAGGTGRADLQAFWGGQIRAAVEREKRYPRTAESDTGTVTLALAVGRDGRLLDVKVARTSWRTELDAAALAAVRAARIPPAPDGFSAARTVFTLRLSFRS